jgi:hypothetical protein
VLISTGRVPPSEPWRILEVAIGQAPDVMALRISKELKRLHESAEALIPMKRNSDGEAEWIVEHVYVRGLNGSLAKLGHVPGIDFVRKESAPPHWIKTLLSQGQGFQVEQADVGSFVRILTGPCARLCGKVTTVTAASTVVAVPMRTKTIVVKTNAENLQTVNCQDQHQSFFFQPDFS